MKRVNDIFNGKRAGKGEAEKETAEKETGEKGADEKEAALFAVKEKREDTKGAKGFGLRGAIPGHFRGPGEEELLGKKVQAGGAS